jgi:hypothetical protein
MSVKINFLNFGKAPVLNFSDSLATAPAQGRNVVNPPSEDWIYIVLSGDTPYSSPIAMPTFTFGQPLAGGGGTGCALLSTFWAANPTYTLASAIAPITTYVGSPVYKSQKKFVQVTFNDSTASAPVIGFANFICASGTGSAGQSLINQDAYTVRCDLRGNLQRWNSGAAVTTLHGTIAGIAQGDIHRLSMDQTVGGQVSLTYTLNGVAQYTVVDNAATAVTNFTFPFLGNVAFANGATGGVKLFSCGTGL